MTVADALAFLVVFVTVPLNWYVTYRLWRLSRANRDVRVLHERAITSTALSVIVTVFGLVFLNNGMTNPILDATATRLITRTATFALTLPAAYSLWLYRGGRRN